MRIQLILANLLVPFYFLSQPVGVWDLDKIVVHENENKSTIIGAEAIFEDRWDVLPQAQFWKQIMQLPPDSCILNVASTRQILAKVSVKDWSQKSDVQKKLFKDSLRSNFGVQVHEQIFITTGKSDFYKFKEVYPSISKGVAAFESFGVDPWYAQAILLIESPGQLKKSISGAYGAFQLMPSVARAQGLVVNSNVDERKDFNRSAYGASRLISRVCIPEAKRILNAKNISFNERDLWFRLFVLHVYHAGSMNVQAVVNKINPQMGSQELIKQMWQTTAGDFGNNSQNYTQLALASQLILNDMVYQNCDDITEFKSTSIN